MSAKRILCFGDSLTWGWNPETRDRFSKEERWTGILANLLGETYEIIEEGLNGRTTGFDDPIEGDKNGRRHLPMLLETHQPLDLIIIMLGTNDLKRRFNLHPAEIAQSAAELVKIARQSRAGKDGSAPSVLLVAPPPIGPLPPEMKIFEGGEEKSKELGHQYSLWAKILGCHFFDAQKVVTTSPFDGIHWDVQGNRAFAQALAQIVPAILEEGPNE
ncbi:MAG: SGNH/GDSL hydrolase family protein [Atribacterota bacterium]